MPFAQPKPSFVINQDVYVSDPDDAKTQYRARIIAAPADADLISIAIYPDPDVLPNFGTLPAAYRIALSKAELSALPLPAATIKSYYAGLVAAGVDAAVIAWQPAVVDAPTPAPVLPTSDKAVKRPEPDGKFPSLATTPTSDAGVVNPDAFKGPAPSGPALQSAPVPPQAVAAVLAAAAPPKRAPNPSLTGPTLPWAQAVKEGDVLLVAPNTGHNFWEPLSGKQARVCDVTMGDGGTLMFAVEIEGGPYPDVDSRRFLEPVAVAGGKEPELVIPWEEYKAYVGTPISMHFNNGIAALNGVLEAVSAEGMTLLGKLYTWVSFAGWSPLKPDQIPGSKEQTKAAKVAEKQQAKDAAVAAINPATALDQAIEACTVAINGKVTKKVLEGILPLLQAAKGAPAQAYGTTAHTGSADYARGLSDAVVEMQKLLVKITGT